jgi:hypothetical protein
MKNQFFLFAFALFLSSCDLLTSKLSGGITSEQLEGTWKLYRTEGIHDGREEMLTPAHGHPNGMPETAPQNSKNMVGQGLILSFFDGQQFSQMTGNGQYAAGKFEMKLYGKELHLNTETGQNSGIYQVKVVNEGNAIQLIIPSRKNASQFFKKIAQPLKNHLDDPYHPINNTWRLKPAQEETTAQLHQRIGNYLKHVAQILTAAKEREQHQVSFEFSVGMLKLFQTGIGAYKLESLPAYWNDGYFNEDQALKAYQIYNKYLEQIPLTKEPAAKWMEYDRELILKASEDALSGKFPE